jgi:hypothetical protein
MSGYSNLASCEWMIAPSSVSAITLNFTELSTQPGVDIIHLFQCTDIACTQQTPLAELSGTYSSPQVVTAGTGFVKVSFTSDESVNLEGFTLFWSTVHSPRVLCCLFVPFILPDIFQSSDCLVFVHSLTPTHALDVARRVECSRHRMAPSQTALACLGMQTMQTASG